MNEHCKRIFRPFNTEHIPYLVDVALPLWGVPSRGERLNRICVEYIVRSCIFENDLNLELLDDGEFCAAAFACRRGDKNCAAQWLSALTQSLTELEMKSLCLSKVYIEAMDEQTLLLMGENDIRLSLFMSRKRGAGLPLFTKFAARLAARGFENLYLWTDCDCNWEWYPHHGFSLVKEGVYDIFSTKDEPYRTFIFKKKLTKE